MCFAAATAMADHVGDKLDSEHILPNMDDWEVFPREAAAVAMKAQEQGLARIHMTYEEEIENAKKIIKRSRDLTQMMMDEKFIPDAPADDGEHKVDIETIKSAY
jgi:malate dehydrogenase (oxaloacetate-decarboxylating)